MVVGFIDKKCLTYSNQCGIIELQNYERMILISSKNKSIIRLALFLIIMVGLCASAIIGENASKQLDMVEENLQKKEQIISVQKTEIKSLRTKNDNLVYQNEALIAENEKLSKENESLSKSNKSLKQQIKKLDAQQTTATVTYNKSNGTSKSKSSLSVPANMHFKSYTNYHCLSRSSAQWKLQEKAHTDNNGLRKIGNDYLVAMGSYYAKSLGDRFRITTSTGNVFTVMICDFKADSDTNSTHQYTSNGCMIEFYVDNNLNSKAKQMGDISYIKGFSGNITKVERL